MGDLYNAMESITQRHERIALQFSGGKDSLATLHLLRPWLGRVVVYWLNTGDPYPETESAVAYARSLTPNFVEIVSDVHAQIAQHGIPSDVVPVSSTPLGVCAAGSGGLIQDRLSCCARTIMLPLHQRMADDGITAIVRGQKNADVYKGPLHSGDTHDGFEFYYPIERWTDAQVMQYVAEHNIPLPAYYNVLTGGPDCMCCSAWWEEGRSRWLRKYPEKFEQYQDRLALIQIAVTPHLAAFNREVE